MKTLDSVLNKGKLKYSTKIAITNKGFAQIVSLFKNIILEKQRCRFLTTSYTAG
jgi:hypothetical protein